MAPKELTEGMGAMLPAITNMYKAGVVTVPYRVSPGGEEGVNYTKYISTDFKEAGKLWGEWLLKALPKGGKVLPLGGPAGNTAATVAASPPVRSKEIENAPLPAAVRGVFISVPAFTVTWGLLQSPTRIAGMGLPSMYRTSVDVGSAAAAPFSRKL